jgi:integrase
MPELLLDAAGRPRSPATLPGFHAGRWPRNKGQRYPADPPTVAEIVAVMRHAGTGLHAARLRALIVVLWRAGLRIHEALALGEADLAPRRGSLLVRRGKGGRRREVGMDDWAWEQLQPWLNARTDLPVGPLLCIAAGPTRGRVVSRRRTHRAAPRCRTSRRAAAIRATPTPPCSRRRDGTRGRPADRYPASARTHEPRDHFDLPAGHRQHRDHRRRPRPPAADGPGRRNAPPVGKPGRRCRSSSDATSPDALGVVCSFAFVGVIYARIHR